MTQLTDLADGVLTLFTSSHNLHWLVQDILPRVRGRYVVVTHNSDHSSPDVQTDKALSGEAHVNSEFLQLEYDNGKLMALHAQNSWWRGCYEYR